MTLPSSATLNWVATIAAVSAGTLLVLVFLASPKQRPTWQAKRDNKRACEKFHLGYGAVWISAFAVIIGCKLYVSFTEWTLLLTMVGLDLLWSGAAY